MNAKETLKSIKTMLGMEVALESMKLENGVVIEAEVFEAGKDVFIVQDDERVALPVGEYILESKQVLVVAEEGVIAEIKEEQAEEAPAEPEAPIDEPEMAQAPEVASPKKVVESVSKETHFAEVEKLQNEIESLKNQITELSKVEETTEVELSTEKVVHTPEVQKEVKLSNNNRPRSTQEIVFSKLFKN